jgi:hypothetical protein
MIKKDYRAILQTAANTVIEKKPEITVDNILKRLKNVVDALILRAGGGEGEKVKELSGDVTLFPEYKDRVNAVKACHKAANNLLDYIKDTYKRELSIKKERQLPAWIHKQKNIMDALNKTRFEDVYSYIVKHTLPMKEEAKICDKLKLDDYNAIIKTGKKKGKIVKWAYVFFRPDYQDMQNTLGIQKGTIQKYIQKFCEIGILLKMRKEGSRQNYIYAVGYYSTYKKGKILKNKRNMFLKFTPEMKKALRNFKISKT